VNRPYIILKAALSLDGYLDDTTESRKIFSSAADIEAVDELRASVDAILIGAGTLRVDQPKLEIRSEKLRKERIAKGSFAGNSDNPWKVVLSNSGALSPEAPLFLVGLSPKLVFVPRSLAPSVALAFGSKAEVLVGGEQQVCLSEVLSSLFMKGVRRLLVEGGSAVIREFIAAGVVDEFRLAYAPEFLGSRGRAPFEVDSASSLLVVQTKNLDGTLVVQARTI